MTFFACVLFCALILLGRTVADCPYQECQCVSFYIACGQLGLTEIPALNSTKTSGLTLLDFSGNGITAIQAGQLPPNLKEISFLDNPISTIDDHAFDATSTTLERLSFSNCLLTRIPNALLRVSNLKMLRIFDARITDWNTEVMKNIGQTAEELYFMNAGTSPNPDWTVYFTRLTMLILDGCSISSLPDDGLLKVASTLTHLSLANNDLTAVPETIAQLRVLKVLVLQNNSISNVSSLPDSDQLVELSLHTNNISDSRFLSRRLQHFNVSLTSLSLNNNQLTEFPNLDFLKNVTSLDFSHNRLSNATSGSVPSFLNALDLHYNSLPSIPYFISDLLFLEDIILPYNAIQEIHATDFPQFVENVDLQHNLIETLTNTSFPVNSMIKFLNLNSNPISDIWPDAFKNLPALRELRMQESRLTRLPLSFPTLASLYFVDFTNSSDLVCTCTEKSLEPWVKSFVPANVVGNCGDTSIYMFFVTLSPTCP